ncbi:MAG: hypothetical protein Q7R85_04730 [bacterium]|nr:hypothetical protein [bacterium]
MQSEVAAGVDRSKIKIGVLAGVGALAAFVFGYALNAMLGGSPMLLGVLGAAAVFMLCDVLEASFIKGGVVYAAVLAVQTTAFLAPLVGHFSQGTLVGAMLMYGLLFVAGRRAQTAAANDLKISILRMSRAATPGTITALSLFVAVLIAAPLIGIEWRVTESTVASIAGSTDIVLRRIVPDFSLAMPVGEVIDAVGSSGLVPGLGELSAEARAALLAESRGAILAQISDAVGTTVTARTTVSKVLATLLGQWASRVPEEWHTVVIVIYGLLLFFTIKSFGFLVAYPVQWAAWGLYQLLLGAGFLRVASEPTSKETIVL